jgi:phage-related protein
MERLLADATKISGVKYDISNLNDVYSAIHVIQTEMGITETTANEAKTTISGSLNMTKAAFQNFLTSLAKGNGIEESFNELLESATTLGENLLPVIEKVLTSIANMIPNVVDKIVTILPGLMKKILPPLINGAVALVNGLIKALPMLIQTILPSLLQGIVSITVEIIKILPELVLMIADMLPTLIPMIVDAILQIIPILIDNMPLFVKAGYKLIAGLAEGILNSIPRVLAIIPRLISSIVNYFRQLPSLMAEVGGMLIRGLWNGISNLTNWVLSRIKGLGNSILKAVKGVFGIHSPSKEFAIIGEYNMLGLEKGMEDMQPEIQRDIDGMFDLSPSMTGSMNNVLSPVVNVYSNVSVEQDPLGQVVNNIKTFSGGARNDYNYGMGA